jgi:hypothetical protein
VAPGVHLNADERELRRIEAGLGVRPRRCAEVAIEVVRPRVIRTLEGTAVPFAARDDVAAMPADVEEGAQLPVVCACDDDGDLARSRREERAVVGYLAGMADVLPRPREDPFVLAAEDVGIGVPRPWQRPLHGREL